MIIIIIFNIIITLLGMKCYLIVVLILLPLKTNDFKYLFRFLLAICISPLKNWNKYTIKGETDHQPRLDAWDKCSGLVHWEDPEGWDGEGVGRGDEDGEHM